MRTDHTPPTDRTSAIETLLADAAAAGTDGASWEVLRRRARALTRDLAGAGITPEGTVTTLEDAPAVVGRALLVAARYVAASEAALASARSDGRREAWESCGTVAS